MAQSLGTQVRLAGINNKHMSNKPEVIQNQIIPLVNEASTLRITSIEDMEIATIILSKLNVINDNIDKEKQKVLTPLNLARTAEINRWKPTITLYEDAIAVLREKISKYQTEAVRARIEAEKAIADRIGEGKGHIKLSTAVKKLEELDIPAEAVTTTFGSLKFRTDKRIRLTDVNLIPRDYLIPDEKKILEALKANKPVAGCEIEEIQVPINNR